MEREPCEAEAGRCTSFPREAEAVLFKFVAKLRSMRVPVFKSSIIEGADLQVGSCKLRVESRRSPISPT